MTDLDIIVASILEKSIPTAHLPISSGISEPGASVPTGHLPSTVPSPSTTIPTTGSGDKK